MQIPPSLFISLAEKNETGTNPEELKKAGKIDFVKVMVYNRPEADEGKTVKEIDEEVREMVDKFGYELMMSMSGDKTVINVFILESGKIISDLLLMAMEGESITMIGLSGELNEEALIKLTSQSNIKSLAPGHLVPW